MSKYAINNILALAVKVLGPHYNVSPIPVSYTVSTVWTDSTGTFHKVTV